MASKVFAILTVVVLLGTTAGTNPALAATLVETIDVGIRPLFIAVNPSMVPDGRIYVVTQSNRGDSAVQVINGTDDSIMAVIPIPDTAPMGIAVNSITNKVYVADKANDEIIVINGDFNRVENERISVGRTPIGIAIHPDLGNQGTVYVTNTNEDSVSVIDAETKQVTNTITVGDFPKGIAVNPSLNNGDGIIYVVNEGDDNVSVIDGATNQVLPDPVPVGLAPFGIAINPDNNNVYVANERNGGVNPRDSVTVFNGETYEIIDDFIRVGNGPIAMAIDTNTNRIYVVNGTQHNNPIYEDSLAMINGNTHANPPNSDFIPVGDHVDEPDPDDDLDAAPFGIVINPVTSKIYVTVRYNNAVEVFEL